MAQSGDPFSSLSGIKSVSAEQYAGAPPQQPSGGMDGTPPGSGYGAPMMRPGGPGADEEARRGVMSLQASLERMQKKYADDIMRVLEAVTIRLERLETVAERNTEAVSELKCSVSELKASTDAAYRAVSDRASEFEATLGTAAAGVQALSDKQLLLEEQQRLAESTLAEAHAELARVKDVARSVAKEVVREVQEQARQQAPDAEPQHGGAPAPEPTPAPAPAPMPQQLQTPPATPELGYAYSAPQQPPPGAYAPQPQMSYANTPPAVAPSFPQSPLMGDQNAPHARPFPSPPPPAAPYPPMPMYPPPGGAYGVPPGMHGEMHPPPPPQMLSSPPPPMDYGGYGAPPPPPPQHSHAPQYHYAPPPPPPPPPRGPPPTPPAQLATSKVPIEKVIDDLSAMGFTRDEVRGVIRSLTENGQSVELNVVIDRLMNGSSDAAQRQRAGWFGR